MEGTQQISLQSEIATLPIRPLEPLVRSKRDFRDMHLILPLPGRIKCLHFETQRKMTKVFILDVFCFA